MRRDSSIEPTPPRMVIAEVIENMALSKTEMARRLGVTRAALHNVLNGRNAVSADFALRFERVTGTAAHVIVKMQADHDLWAARRAETARQPDAAAAV